MSVTPQDVQAKLDQALVDIEGATSTHAQMVKKYGKDWTKWGPNTAWFKFLTVIAEARAEVGQLTTKKLSAGFKHTP